MNDVGWLPGLEYLYDANCSSRKGTKAEGIVIHGTGGGNGRLTAKWAADADLSRSWHFIVCRDGHTIQQVPVDSKAWHCGRSVWFRAMNPNRYTVGIELANHLLLVREADGPGYRYELGGKLWPYRGLEPVKAELIYDCTPPVVVEGWWEPYPDAQIEGLLRLLEMLEVAQVPIRLIGHEEIRQPLGGARGKIDPGPLFPWELFTRRDPRLTSAVML